MARIRFDNKSEMDAENHQLDSLFLLRHAQRADKIATTVSSIDFVSKNNPYDEYIVTDSFNPALATFQSTGSKSNNGYTQSMEMGQKLLSYVQSQIKEPVVILSFHSSPYLRCVQTVKLMVDYITKRHRDQNKRIKIVIHIDHFLSEWLSSDLDINYYPPNDNGESLLSFAIQYLNSNISFNSVNHLVDVRLDFSNSYKFGNPGPYNESFAQQYSRSSKGLISLVKDTCENLTDDRDRKEILLVMTHGAVVRSLVSKLIGKSLYVEIPLASMSIAKPLTKFNPMRKYTWKLLETDIEIKANIEYNAVDIFSNTDPFQDIQLTFNHKTTGRLNFKSEAEKPSNTSRFRSQSLLAPKIPHDDSDSDSSDSSDNEGITFHAGRRRSNTTTPRNSDIDKQKRYRSSSLFGPVLKNPFFSDAEKNKSPVRRAPLTQNVNTNTSTFPIKTPKPIRKQTIKIEDQLIAPGQSSNDCYQNIDADDGSHCAVEYVPELLSNNSSTNSFDESINQLTIFPGSFSNLNYSNTDSSHENDDLTPNASDYKLSKSSNSSMITLEDFSTDKTKSQNFANDTKSKSLIFDKALIEKSLNEIQLSPSPDQSNNDINNNTNKSNGTTDDAENTLVKPSILEHHEEPEASNWMMSFSNSERSNERKSQSSQPKNKFKIDLYEKKNRFGLSLYDDRADDDYDDDDGELGFGFGKKDGRRINGGFKSEIGGDWFLGSNKY